MLIKKRKKREEASELRAQISDKETVVVRKGCE